MLFPGYWCLHGLSVWNLWGGPRTRTAGAELSDPPGPDEAALRAALGYQPFGANRVAQSVVDRTGLSGQPATAAHVVAYFRGGHQVPSVEGVASDGSLPPPQPNVYTDASVVHPTAPYRAVGGYGIWHPERHLASAWQTYQGWQPLAQQNCFS